MFSSLSLSKKIMLGVAILIAGYLGSAGYSFFSGAHAETQLRQASSRAFPLAMSSKLAVFAFEEADKAYNDAMLTGDEEVLAVAGKKSDLALATLSSLVELAGASSEVSASLTRAAKAVADHREQGRSLFKAAATRTDATKAAVQEQARTFGELSTRTRQSLDQLATGFASELKTSLSDVAGATRSQRFGNAILCAVIIILGSAAVLLILRGANRSLALASQTLEESTSQITEAASQVSSASQKLAEGSSQQAASLEETSASFEEMSSMTKRNADGAKEAKDLASQTRSAAEVGARDMEEMKTAMAAIQASSDGIAKIIKAIDEIAFQTNILALNAAVEAARAGDAGMGFAVVAEEVRRLAQRSAESAKETASKIDEAIQRSSQGVAISTKVATSLSEIVDKARKMDSLVAEIAHASSEQAQGIGQVNNAILQIDKITQSNAASAEETAAAATDLTGQTETLQEAVLGLNRLVNGANSTDYAPPPPAREKPIAAEGVVTVMSGKGKKAQPVRASTSLEIEPVEVAHR